MRATRYVGAVAAVVLAAACGSTAQVTRTTTIGGPGGGLSVPEGTSGATGSTGASGDGTTGGTGTSGSPLGGTTGATSTTTGSGTGGGSVSTTTGVVPRATGPIKVGILLTKVGQADALGLSVGNTFSERQFDDAVINGLNKRGGLHGRRIVPVYAATDTASSNWESDYSAACATFTQDNHVDVVLGSSFAYFASFERCLARAGIPHLSNTSNVADNGELGQFPLFRALIVPTIDKRSIAKLQGAIATGFLTPKNKLGVITDSCPGTQRAWKQVVQPYLAAHRITVAATADEGCADGYNASFSSAGAAVSNAILTFQANGVDRVTFITVSESGTMLVMAQGAQSQHYNPGWIVSSLVGSAFLQTQAPPEEQMATTRVYGWLPSQDVSPALYDPPNAAQRRCYSFLKESGIKPTSTADYSYSQSICEALFAYEAALGRSGSIQGGALVRGLDGLGTSFQSVFSLDGATLFRPDRRNDVPRLFREAVWRDSCSCFVYHGPRFPMP